jgi:hypothetical protein
MFPAAAHQRAVGLAACRSYGTSQYAESEQAQTLKPDSHTTSQVGA